MVSATPFNLITLGMNAISSVPNNRSLSCFLQALQGRRRAGWAPSQPPSKSRSLAIKSHTWLKYCYPTLHNGMRNMFLVFILMQC